MLELENLSAETFEEIVEAAKKQIAYLYPDWTDTGESDPGVTLIELLAWLKVLQQEYMNTVQDTSRQKLLGLLGLHPRGEAPAATTLTLSGVAEDCLLPAGAQAFAGDICFETVSPRWLAANSITRLSVRDAAGKLLRAAIPEEVRALAVFGEAPAAGAALEIGLERPLAAGRTLSMALRVVGESPRRNPIARGDGFIPLCDLGWEYYGEADGQEGWHPARVEADETYGLLQNGALALAIDGRHMALEGVYPLRAVLRGGWVDHPPRLAGVALNAVEAEQRRTVCAMHPLSAGPGRSAFRLDHALAASGGHLALERRGGDGFAPAAPEGYKLEQRPQEGCAHITIENTGEPAEYIFIFFDTDFQDSMILGSGTGISFQRIGLPFEHIEGAGLSLLVDEGATGAPRYHVWSQVEDFFASRKDDRHFVLEPGGVVQFGDHVRGMAPPKGRDNILLGALALALGAGGNLQAGRINRLHSRLTALAGAAVAQPDPAEGGRDRESLEEAEARIPALFGRRGSLVTRADYEQAVRTAPGLHIRNVKVLPGYARRKDGTAADPSTVTLVVEGSGGRQSGLPEAYRRNLAHRLEGMRLIGTQIEIVSPQYIGVEIRGTVTLKPYFKDGPETVLAAIGGFIEQLNQSFGQTLYYGDLYGLVDMLPCVSQVRALDIEPYGRFVEKTPAGDVRIPPDGGYYLRRTEIVFN